MWKPPRIWACSSLSVYLSVCTVCISKSKREIVLVTSELFTKHYIIIKCNKLICPGTPHILTHTLKYTQSIPVLILIAATDEEAHKHIRFPFYIYTQKHHTNVNCTSTCLAEHVNQQNYWWGFYYVAKHWGMEEVWAWASMNIKSLCQMIWMLF